MTASANTFSAAYLYSAETRLSYPVALTPVGKLERPLGFGFDVDLSAFAGVADDRPVTGLWASVELRIARNAWMSAGPALRFEQGRLRTEGLVLGFRINL